ncbi:MAG: hypothetical protein ACXW4M_08705 [Anaerolineales bacterium]
MSPPFFSSVTAAKTAISSEDSLLSCDHACIPPLSSLVWVAIVLGVYALVTGVVLAAYIGWVSSTLRD